ncbi:MAG TPA: DUF5995 family protein [Acidobacteriaceae bacterium]|nr:DUF5995 family protein [Acidobacteriaceae bacterium]
MFPYDNALLAAVQAAPQSVADVLNTMQVIDGICIPGDGLKWFNWLYYQVTQAVETRVSGGGFNNPAWLSTLDVKFATLFFDALRADLTGASVPGCWSAMFSVRDQQKIARIQFALAGVNAHINHDLPLAIMTTCQDTGTVPQHGTPEYSDYTSLNTNLDGLIAEAKSTLNVRLLGDDLPAISHLSDTIAAWNLSAARENAWNTAQSLWQQSPALVAAHVDIIDGLTTVISKSLLVPVP